MALRYEPSPYTFPEGRTPPKPKAVNQASHVVRSYLILYRAPKDLVAAPTLRVSGVTAKSNAATAGMKAGDYLASYDGRRLDSVDDLRAAIGAAVQAGKERIEIVVFRDGERLVLELAAGRMGINLSNR